MVRPLLMSHKMKHPNNLPIGLLLLLAVTSSCNACHQRPPTAPPSPQGQELLQQAHARKFPSDKLELYVIDHFLADAECDQLVAIIKRHLTPSRITGQRTEPDKYRNQKIRTSSTAYLSSLSSADEKAFVDAITQKISQAIGIPASYAEGMQGQHYQPGQEFKEHLDAFDRTAPEWKHASGPTRGNRTWTFMIYLNDVEQGGATHFLKLKHTIRPRKGQAIVWNNLNQAGTRNPAAYHSGRPVLKGTKTIITQWFRQRPSVVDNHE